MMTSKNEIYHEAYVWTWLPQETAPVVAGKLTLDGTILQFNYGKSYLERANAIAIYDKELPLKAGIIKPLGSLPIAGCLRDAAPDAWGRRVILNRKFGRKGSTTDTAQLDELTYLLESGSDRIGTLDFQLSAKEFQPRDQQTASLEELQRAAEQVELGIPLNTALSLALQHGTSIGGARPKTLIESDDEKFIAKFSTQSDSYNVVKAEFIAMTLAKFVGIAVAPVRLQKSLGKDVILIKRFDRVKVSEGWQRKGMVSALTIQQLDEMMARYASYEDMAEKIRSSFSSPSATLRELFSRLIFNILCGNTDDHARNHAAFWNGKELSLTPAYDICPQPRVGRESSQAMLIHGQDRRSRLATCLEAAANFQLKRKEALDLMRMQVESIKKHWDHVCDMAELSKVDRNFFWERQFLNAFAFEELEILDK